MPMVMMSGPTSFSFLQMINAATRRVALHAMFSDLLREAGYRTACFGKWHLNMPKAFRPEDHFDGHEKIVQNRFGELARGSAPRYDHI